MQILFYICDGLPHTLPVLSPPLVQLCDAFTFCVFGFVHFLEAAGFVTCDQVSLAFNNNDEMKASYVGTSDQCNLSHTHVDSCQGPRMTFGLWLTCLDTMAIMWGRLRIYLTRPEPFLCVHIVYMHFNFLNLMWIMHVSDLATSLELTIWSAYIPVAYWNTVLKERNHSLLMVHATKLLMLNFNNKCQAWFY